ncbi:MAG: hypothetical protein LBR80_02400 [Deltaproteobacteria bacterium]|jgi:hypothetical protein|nr:hypothetical protein [Deltaproteobacteria bacterium]
MSEVATLAWLPGGPVAPDACRNGVPEAMKDLLELLRGLGEFTFEQLDETHKALAAHPTWQEWDDRIHFLISLTVIVMISLTVIEPSGVKDGQTLWRVDPILR